MLSKLLRQFLLVLVHFVVSVLVAVQNVYHKYWIRRLSGSKNTKNDIEVILKHIPTIKKKPKHIVLLVDTDKHTLTDLALVVIWTLVAGIPHISFHDITGELNESKLFTEVEKCKKGIPGCIKWSNMPNLNGYTNGIQAHTVNINIFTSDDGRPKITECVRQIAESDVKYRGLSNELTAHELDEVISKCYPSIPDPDLIMFSGSLCCTHGLLPWQLRLTEFVQVSLDYSINVENYIGALYKYNKCDQRFGK